MVKLATLSVLAFAISLFAVQAAQGQTASPTPTGSGTTATPTMTSAPTRAPTPTGSVQGTQTTVSQGAPATGHGGN